MMKTNVTLRSNLLKSLFFILLSASGLLANARTSSFGKSPVIASSFTAVLNNNGKVDLKWITDQENNLSHFIVERSTDGKNFSDAALVFAYGNTTAESVYAFADNISKVKSVVVYYRLISIEADGASQYSGKVIKITKKD